MRPRSVFPARTGQALQEGCGRCSRGWYLKYTYYDRGSVPSPPLTAVGNKLGLFRPKWLLRAALQIPIDSPSLFPITNPATALPSPQSWKYCAPFCPRLLSAGATCRSIHHDHERAQSEQYNTRPPRLASPRLVVPCHICLSLESPVPTPCSRPHPLPKLLIPSIHTIGFASELRPGCAHRHRQDSSSNLATLATPAYTVVNIAPCSPSQQASCLSQSHLRNQSECDRLRDQPSICSQQLRCWEPCSRPCWRMEMRA